MSAAEPCGYIYVRNWERFQHYKGRRPVWIKLYLDLLNDDGYLALTPSDRCLLQGCWMAIAEYGNGRCRADLSTLRARSKSPKGSLKRLNNAGFIEILASKLLATELEADGEIETAAAAADQNGATNPGDSMPQALAAELDRWRETTGRRLTQSALDPVTVAWRQDAAGTAYCMTEAAERAGVSSRPGLLLTMLDNGDHLAGAPTMPPAGDRTNGDQAPVVPLVPCQRCDGTTWIDADDDSDELVRCPTCDGDGRVPAGEPVDGQQ